MSELQSTPLKFVFTAQEVVHNVVSARDDPSKVTGLISSSTGPQILSITSPSPQPPFLHLTGQMTDAGKKKMKKRPEKHPKYPCPHISLFDLWGMAKPLRLYPTIRIRNSNQYNPKDDDINGLK